MPSAMTSKSVFVDIHQSRRESRLFVNVTASNTMPSRRGGISLNTIWRTEAINMTYEFEEKNRTYLFVLAPIYELTSSSNPDRMSLEGEIHTDLRL